MIYPFSFNPSEIDIEEFNATEHEVVFQNLQYQSIPQIIISKSGYICNREQSKNFNFTTFFDYYDMHFKYTWLNQESTPYLIIDTEGSFTHLNYILYNDEIIEHLNTNGLKIYFRELPHFGINKNVLLSPGGDISFYKFNNINYILKNTKPLYSGFMSTKKNLQDMFCYEFDIINQFVTKNKLTNVTLCTSQYNINKYLGDKYDFKLKTKDLGLTIAVNDCQNLPFTFMTYDKNSKIPDKDVINYKFICTNKSYEGYRHLVAAYLYKRSSQLSFNYKNFDFVINTNRKKLDLKTWDQFWDNINNVLWFDFNDLKTIDPDVYHKLDANLKKLKKIKHLTIDKDLSDPLFEKWLLDRGDYTSKFDPFPFDSYAKSFCAIVTESVYAQPFGHFADKSLNAIKCFRPFVLVGPPHTLEYMHKLGLKTFNDYWDESYDLEKNHTKRLLKIFKVIDYINSKSLTELKEIYNEMIPILIYNHQLIEKFKSTEFIEI